MAPYWLPGLVLFGILVLSQPIRAQDVIAQPPEIQITPPAVQENPPSQMQVFTPTPPAPGTAPRPLQWGPVTFKPRAYYRFLYGNDIATVTSNHASTAIQTLSPGFFFGIGTHWTLDYAPTWSFYSNKQFRDTLDHNVRLTGGTSYEDWTFGFFQGYTASFQPLVETGTQTDQENYSTALTASYLFNSEMSMDLGLYQNFVLTTAFENTREWSTMDWLNYQFWPRLAGSIGVGGGYVAVDTGDDMVYEHIEARARWRATDKLSVDVHGGVELRQVQNSSDNLVNPIAAARIQYQPFEVTRLSLNVDRKVEASYFQNQVTENTTVAAQLDQRLLKWLHFDFSAGYDQIQYVSSIQGTSGRKDNYWFVNVSLGCSILKHGSAAVFYRRNENNSSAPGLSFASNQGGFELGYTF